MPLNKLINDAKTPGLSMATVSESGVITTQAVGITNINDPNPITDQTVFEAASLSKPVFAFMVLKMVQLGAFSRPGESAESGLDRPLHEICAFGPPHLQNNANYKLLTVRRILSHQAGLPNQFPDVASEKFENTPGTQFNYSGVAYYFLNTIVEHLFQKNLETISKKMFSDLNMHNTSFVAYAEGLPQRTNRAIGHNAEGILDESEHFPINFGPHPAASLLTTADDYAKFLKACMKDEFIFKQMFTNTIELENKDQKAIDAGVLPADLTQIKWGLGFGLQTKPGDAKIAFHWGDINTSRSFVAINLETKKAVVCLTNSSNGPMVFKSIAEPVVGDLSASLNWLSQRENFKMEPEVSGIKKKPKK